VGIRQSLNRNPILSSVIAGAIVVIVSAMQLRNGCSDDDDDELPPPEQRKQFFTIDDGQNWFAADATKVPPFKHQGKDAYRVAVYRCRDGKEFASRLERFPEPARKRLQDGLDQSRARGEPLPDATSSLNPEMEVKRPGQPAWVRYTAKTADAYAAVMEVQCPDGSGDAVRVFPE
jgi:hypothetical protein